MLEFHHKELKISYLSIYGNVFKKNILRFQIRIVSSRILNIKLKTRPVSKIVLSVSFKRSQSFKPSLFLAIVGLILKNSFGGERTIKLYSSISNIAK